MLLHDMERGSFHYADKKKGKNYMKGHFYVQRI